MLPRQRSTQMILDWKMDNYPLTNYRDGSVVVGDFFEELASSLLHFPRLVTDGSRSTCPDLYDGKNLCIESKAGNVVTSRHFLICTDQVEHYQSLEESSSQRVFYLLWCYQMSEPDPSKIGSYRDRESLKEALARSKVEGWFFPLSYMTAALSGRKAVRYGRGRADEEGRFVYVINMREIPGLWGDRCRVSALPPIAVYDKVVSSVLMHTPKPLG